MDQFVNGSLRTWRLETQHDVNGDRHHQRSTGPESWRAIRQIGHGTFGEVWQERCLSGPSQNAFRAVKHIPKRQSTFAEVSRRELEALTTFSDSRIPEYKRHFVQCLGWFDNAKFIYIAMEFLEYGDLQQYITKPFPEPEAALVTSQVAQALQYMHQKNYVHRDIKPLNTLVAHLGPEWHVKVADFGIAKNTDGTILGTQEMGTRGYVAPELFSGSSYTAAVDVWALGAVAYCLRTGSPPLFHSIQHLLDYSRDHKTKFPIGKLGQSSGFCLNFVMSSMAETPERRLTIEEALAHDWISEQLGATKIHQSDESFTNSSSSLNMSPSNTWSRTYDAITSQQLPPSLPARPITQPDLAPPPKEPPVREVGELGITDTNHDQHNRTEDIDEEIPGGDYTVRVTIIKAEGLHWEDIFRYPDPFAVVTVNGVQKRMTGVITKTLNPSWNESFDMKVDEDSILMVKIFDQKNSEKEDQGFLGMAKQRIGRFIDLDAGGDKTLTRYLRKPNSSDDIKGELIFGIVARPRRLLPRGWERREDSNGQTYYANHNTRQTTWAGPGVKLPEGWELRKNGEGLTYYVDHNTKRTMWERPRKFVDY